MNTLLQIAANGTSDIEGDIKAFSLKVVMIASLLLVVLLLSASVVVKNKRYKILKMPFFVAIASTIILPSLLLMGSTVYINTISESGGPVHWHTDIEFWVCGEEIELRDPYEFLSNKIGTSTYHEHDDKRIHLEGVVIEKEYDASLEKFMDVTDGKISNTELVIPTDDSIFENDTDGDTTRGNENVVRDYLQRDANGKATIAVENGKSCGNNEEAEVQAFLFRFNKENDTYAQTKLEEPARYIMRDESVVPPGDCVIVEFDTFKQSTDKLCQQYGVRDRDRCTEFGVTTYNADLCSFKQIVTEGGTL
ncbi:MAG: hypothetical protein ACI9T8_000370 [Candidatus Saccharimonadales bacterium]|jgi:hypothetical protein